MDYRAGTKAIARRTEKWVWLRLLVWKTYFTGILFPINFILHFQCLLVLKKFRTFLWFFTLFDYRYTVLKSSEFDFLTCFEHEPLGLVFIIFEGSNNKIDTLMLIVTAIIGHLSLHSGFAWLIGELRGFMKLNLEFFVMCGHNFKAS